MAITKEPSMNFEGGKTYKTNGGRVRVSRVEFPARPVVGTENTMNFEVGKTYKTRSGQDARIISVAGPAKNPIVAVVGEAVLVYPDNGAGVVAEDDLMPPDKRQAVVDAAVRFVYGHPDSAEPLQAAVRAYVGSETS